MTRYRCIVAASFAVAVLSNSLASAGIHGTDLGYGYWIAEDGWHWNDSWGGNWGYGRYELWNVTPENGGAPITWYSGQDGCGDLKEYTAPGTQSAYGFTSPSIRSKHVWGPVTVECGGETRSNTHTETITFTRGINYSTSTEIGAEFSANFEAHGVGVGLGLSTKTTTTFGSSFTYGEAYSNNFPLSVPPPCGEGPVGGPRTRDFFLDYRADLYVWSGKLRGVVYDNSDYTDIDDYVIPDNDANVYIYEMVRSVKDICYTESVECCVPEPSSLIVWSLIGLTFAGIGWRRRRKE